MDRFATNTDFLPGKVDEIVKDGALFHCNLFDTDMVHKITQSILFGLATACIDNTTGNAFSSPAYVAVDMRKEMVDYLIQRSETFISQYLIHEGDPIELAFNPHEIISEFIEDFVSTKRNLFSRVSASLMSEYREEKIEDFVQDMELESFWPIDRRETVAQTMLKNVDIQNKFHCNMKYDSPEELENHALLCNFRSLSCGNEGCRASFSAGQRDSHDLVCPFKIVPCEQKCSGNVMRRDMDRHCITVCPMKLINCPFGPVGCRSTIVVCMLNQHCLDALPSHLLYVLQDLHKDVAVTDLELRVKQLMQVSSPGGLARAQDVRYLISAIKSLEVELGPLEIASSADFKETADKVEDR